jgi:hypothetical protein
MTIQAFVRGLILDDFGRETVDEKDRGEERFIPVFKRD